MESQHAYLFLELAVLLMLLAFWDQRFTFARLRVEGLFLGTGVLIVVWTCVDQIALSVGLWTFPAGGTLPVRILRLPIEEYFAFLIHGLLTFTLMKVLDAPQE